MALRWIQENIGSFGGDRNTVTLWGHGEAASLVHMLALARKTEGLFNRYVTRYKPVPFCSVLFCSSSISEQKLRTWILKKEEHMVSNRYIIQSATALCPMAVNSKTRTRKVALATAKSFDCLPRKDEENVTTMRTNVTNEEKEREEEEEEEEGLDEKQEMAMMHCLREVKEIGRFRKVMNYPVRQPWITLFSFWIFFFVFSFISGLFIAGFVSKGFVALETEGLVEQPLLRVRADHRGRVRRRYRDHSSPNNNGASSV